MTRDDRHDHRRGSGTEDAGCEMKRVSSDYALHSSS